MSLTIHFFQNSIYSYITWKWPCLIIEHESSTYPFALLSAMKETSSLYLPSFQRISTPEQIAVLVFAQQNCPGKKSCRKCSGNLCSRKLFPPPHFFLLWLCNTCNTRGMTKRVNLDEKVNVVLKWDEEKTQLYVTQSLGNAFLNPFLNCRHAQACALLMTGKKRSFNAASMTCVF